MLAWAQPASRHRFSHANTSGLTRGRIYSDTTCNDCEINVTAIRPNMSIYGNDPFKTSEHALETTYGATLNFFCSPFPDDYREQCNGL